MAIVNMSVDTNTRVVAVTVDGQLVPAIECHLSKFRDMDGDADINLSYTLEADNGNGLQERTVFFLPRKDDVFASLNDNGLATRKEVNKDEVAKDIDKFIG